MFFGVNLLFGSVFVWLAMFSVGPRWAILSAFVGALHTVDLWGHWYAVILFSFEAAFVVFICRAKSTSRLNVSVLLFWLCLGIPLSLLFYSKMLGMPWATAILVASKQALNGQINAMIAAFIVTSILFFRPNLKDFENLRATNSYSDLLQAIFGLAFLAPILLSEFHDLRQNFSRQLEHDLEHTATEIQSSALNISSFLRLETAYWGSNVHAGGNGKFNPSISTFVDENASAAPSHIFELGADGDWSQIYGKSDFNLQIFESNFVAPLSTVKQIGFFWGCLKNHFVSIFLAGPNDAPIVFVWAPNSLGLLASMGSYGDFETNCIARNAEKLETEPDQTSVSIFRDMSSSTSTLGSWQNATVRARTALASLAPATLELTSSLSPKIAKIQTDTNHAVQRLYLLAMLVVLGGQLLDFLFRRWIEKFTFISETFLRERKPPSYSINPNFKEDQAITTWLNRFTGEVETAEQRKLLAQRNFEMLLWKATTPIFATNDHHEITDWNPALMELTGYCKDEVVGSLLTELVHIPPEIAASNNCQAVSDLLVEVRTKSGKRVHLVVSQLLVDTEQANFDLEIQKTGSIGASTKYYIAQNLSELKKAQAKLIHASRLAALGEMASSIAHELNQPLNIISISAGNILERAKSQAVPHEYLVSKLQRIETQSLRAGKIIQGIRQFVLEIGDEEVTLFDPITRTRSAVDLMREQLRLDCIVVSISDRAGPVEISGRPILFEQTMVNLINNARQAMRHQCKSPREIAITFQVEDDILTVLVKDAGPGISEDIIEHVFDPFFSTKSNENGTGVGLYICKSFVEAMSGQIRAVESACGACIEIKLPIADAS